MTTDIARVAGAAQSGDDAPGEAERGVVTDAAGLLAELNDEVRQLKEALDSNRRIGMAMGLVMAQLQVTDDEAFDALRRISQNTNRKLRDVADDVLQHRGLQGVLER
jgi:AmiR/NasT family two-component response regulator